MSKNTKINWLLILQGWAMLWVVIGHSFLGKAGEGPAWENALFNFAYSFHMPLFMFVSGWLFYPTRLSPKLSNWGGHKWSYAQIVKDKTIRLLLPGLVFSIVAFVIKTIAPGEVARQTGVGLRDVAHAFLYPNDNPFRELWFIGTLFWFFLFTPIWRAVLRDKRMMWSTLVALVIMRFFHPDTEFLCIGRVFNYAIWFYLGVIVSKEDIVDRWLLGRAQWTLAAGLIIYIMGIVTHGFITTLGGIILSLGLTIIADKYIPRVFSGFRNYTYQIFLMGIFAQMAVKIAYRHVAMPYIGAYILCILAGLYVPVLVSKLIEKVNWNPLSLCVGLKTK